MGARCDAQIARLKLRKALPWSHAKTTAQECCRLTDERIGITIDRFLGSPGAGDPLRSEPLCVSMRCSKVTKKLLCRYAVTNVASDPYSSSASLFLPSRR